MVEDRKQKPNSWDEKVTTDGEYRKLGKIMEAVDARLARFWITVIFLCGMCVGIGLILAILNMGAS